MDPLSIIASIAGISQAGATLSKTIYEFISSMRGAPKEIADIARGIHDLSLILSELRLVLRDGRALCRRKLLRQIRSASRRIHTIHKEIEHLIDVDSGFGRLKWALRRSASLQLLYRIEGHKNAINMVVLTISLAIQIRTASSLQDADHVLRRQQTENTVQAALQSIRELSHDDTSTENANSGGDPEKEFGDRRSPETEQDIPTNHLTLSKGAPDDTAEWLYGLILAPYAEAHAEINDVTDAGASTEPNKSSGDAPTSALAAWGRGDLPLLRSTKPIQGSKVVEELLGEWTILSEDEIKSVPIRSHTAEPAAGFAQKDPRSQDLKGVESMKAQEDETVIFKDAVILKDAVGRKLAFPIDKVKTWKGIEELIKQAFKHVDVVGPHVQEGHYDVIMCGMIVLPQVWDCWIRPGVMVEMRMWPMDKPCPAVIRDRRPMDTRNISESAMAWMQGVTKPKVVSGGNPPNPPAKHEQPLAPQQAGQAPSKPSPVSVGTNMPAEAPASLPRLGAKSPRRDLEGSTLSGNGSTLGDNKQQNTTEERKRPRKKVS